MDQDKIRKRIIKEVRKKYLLSAKDSTELVNGIWIMAFKCFRQETLMGAKNMLEKLGMAK